MYMGLFLQSLSDFPEINSMTNKKKQGERNFSSRMNKNCNQTGKKKQEWSEYRKKKADCKASGSIHLWSHAHED